MSFAGPSRPRLVFGTVDRNNYEEDLTRMVTQLDLSAIERLQASYGARVRRGQTLSDHEIALVLLMQNARELADLDADRAVAQQLALEEGEELDPAPRVPLVVAPQLEPTIKNVKSKKRTRGKGKSKASSSPTPVSSGQTASKLIQAPRTAAKAPPRATGHDCVICQDPIFQVEIRAPCGHFYDIGCITDLFQSATRDESLYPPRCCRQNIPLPQVRPYLKEALLTEYELKAREFGTLKRVYCAAPACSWFLGPLCESSFSQIFTCTSPTRCTTRTCGKCRGRYEGLNHHCTPDVDTEQVLKLSRASGWSRCPGCAQMIELDMGCHHMTCRCKTEFCYLCRAPWKTCQCPQWDEERLLAAAEHRADAQLQPANPARQVHEWQQVIARGARNQPVNPPGQTHATAPRPPPVGNIRHATLRADVPVFVPRSLQPVTHRAGATAPALPRTWAMVAAANVRDWSATRLESQRGITENAEDDRNAANTADDWNTGNTSDDDAVDDWYAARNNLVEEIMERLRVDHDCQHTTWKYRYGGGSCETCFEYLPNYLFRCGKCQMLSCNRCRLNRL